MMLWDIPRISCSKCFMTAFLLRFLYLRIPLVPQFFNLLPSPVFLTLFLSRRYLRHGWRRPNYHLLHTVTLRCYRFWYFVRFSSLAGSHVSSLIPIPEHVSHPTLGLSLLFPPSAFVWSQPSSESDVFSAWSVPNTVFLSRKKVPPHTHWIKDWGAQKPVWKLAEEKKSPLSGNESLLPSPWPLIINIVM
jgi:hypothetical protein